MKHEGLKIIHFSNRDAETARLLRKGIEEEESSSSSEEEVSTGK